MWQLAATCFRLLKLFKVFLVILNLLDQTKRAVLLQLALSFSQIINEDLQDLLVNKKDSLSIREENGNIKVMFCVI